MIETFGKCFQEIGPRKFIVGATMAAFAAFSPTKAHADPIYQLTANCGSNPLTCIVNAADGNSVVLDGTTGSLTMASQGYQSTVTIPLAEVSVISGIVNFTEGPFFETIVTAPDGSSIGVTFANGTEANVDFQPNGDFAVGLIVPDAGGGDLAYAGNSSPPPSGVPEPPSGVLLGGALVAAGLFGKRSRALSHG